jgi:ribose 1,5-bisphosphokinase
LPEGILVGVVGPSGAGKDTILAKAAASLAGRDDIHFVRRVITRVADGVSEDHDTLTEAAFERAQAEGAFCLTWGAHGLRYGLPASALLSARQGKTVVANLSRTVLHDALAAFGRLGILEISADPLVLADRIAARGRETRAEIEARIARAVVLTAPQGTRYVRIDNSGRIETASGAFLEALQTLSASPEEGGLPLPYGSPAGGHAP